MPTSTPWDGTSWDVTAPDIDQIIGNHYKEMFDLRKGVGIRIDKEHITLAGSSAGGEHVQGSARAWFQDAVPALQPDGTALAATDNGMLWFDSNSTPDNLAYVLVDHSDPTVGNGWVLLSVSMTAEIVAAAHQWAAIQTFDLQTVHTLGLLANASVTLGAGADIIGSSTSDITINTDKFTVAGATGNTVVAGTLNVGGAQEVTGVATLGDGSLLKTAAAPTTDPMITNKKYVDDAIPAAFSPSSLVGASSSDTDSPVTFPNGFQMAWGSDSIGSNATKAISHGLTNACFTAWATNNEDNSTDRWSLHVHTFGDTTFEVTNTDGATVTFEWVAIGR